MFVRQSSATSASRMTNRTTATTLFALTGAALLMLVLIGCDKANTGAGDTQGAAPSPSAGERQFITIGTAPSGGMFFTFGGAVADTVGNAPGLNWRVNAEPTGGSMENIRMLDAGDIQFAMSNSSITYFAVRGQGDWDKPYDVRAIMTLFPNVAMFITPNSTGIQSIADLKGKRVSVGPPGAGFEYFVGPILNAHGVTYDDFEAIHAGQDSAADILGDGRIDAAFLGGGVPTASISRAASSITGGVLLIPFDVDAKAALIRDYPFFHEATIPAGTYKGQDETYPAMNVGSAHLITHASVDDDTVYQFTKALWEGRESMAAKLPPARAMKPPVVVQNTGAEFHPGAIRFYKEIGIWPGASAGDDATASDELSSTAADASPIQQNDQADQADQPE